MAELKTKMNDASVENFFSGIPDEKKQEACVEIDRLMRAVSGCEPRMWGKSIVGYGLYRYKYASGREGEWFRIGFSPRKQNITLYTMCGLEKSKDILYRLGKYKIGKSCLYIKKLEDVNLKVLEELLMSSVRQLESPGHC